jgi:hypothetical protein
MLSRSSFISSALKTASRYYTLPRTYIQQSSDGKAPKMADPRSAEDFMDMAEELDSGDRGGKRGARGGRMKSGGRGGSGSRGNRVGGSGGQEMNREVAVSKALSKLLRHVAVDAGLKLDPEGFARVDQVVSPGLVTDSPRKGGGGRLNVHVTCMSRAHIAARYN